MKHMDILNIRGKRKKNGNINMHKLYNKDQQVKSVNSEEIHFEKYEKNTGKW